MSQRYAFVPAAPEFHVVPLTAIRAGGGEIVIELDDVDQRRFRFSFTPHQALRVTTVDCFVRPEGAGYEVGRLLEVFDSGWLGALRESLNQVDKHANFLDGAHHYLIDAGDDVIEVVAWGVTWEAA